MAKAAAPDTTALSASEAASAIVALINSRTQSPWPQEIEAIIARAIAPVPARLSLSQKHLEFRRLVAELECNEPQDGEPEDEKKSEANEATTGRLCDQISAIESEVWSAPARTLADVLLRGEIALYNENGVMDFIDDADAYEDDRAIAQLIRAVVDVLGKV